MEIDEILIAIIYMQMYINIALVAIIIILCILLIITNRASNDNKKNTSVKLAQLKMCFKQIFTRQPHMWLLFPINILYHILEKIQYF